jgi:hypothetical protein
VALTRREDLEARSGVDIGRLARRGGSSLTWLVLVVVAIALTIGISLNLRHRWDVSARHENTLSPQTLQILAGLESEVKIYPLFTSTNAMRNNYWFFLQLYREASPKVKVEFIDPVARPGEVQALGLDPEQEDARRDGMTVVIQEEDKRIFDGIDEESVTNAILDVSTTAPRVVGFVRGYGERDPTSEDDAGLSRLAVELLEEYYRVRDVTLSDGVPADVTVLVVAGVRLPIPEADLQVLAEWMENGGRLLVLADPGSDPSINAAIEKWGLRVLFDPVIEPRSNVNNDPTFVKAAGYSDHEIVEGFSANFPSGFPLVSRVEHFEPGDPLVYHESVVSSSIVSSVVHDGVMVDGPFDLAAASWRRGASGDVERETRAIVVGDSDFATNQNLYFRANRNFVLNCLGWLSRESGLVSVRRAPAAAQVVDVEYEDRGMLYAAAYGAPALVVLLGTVIFFRRRSL